MSKVTFTVNGLSSTIDVEPRTLLADALRDELGLTGTHIGCDTSQCGCCTVRMDGSAIKSCTVLAVQAQGSRIETIEGLAEPEVQAESEATSRQLHPVQQAFSSCHALQCGFCTPGMIMATVELLDQHPDPSDEQIREGLSGNLCRCTGYVNIENAVREAAAIMRADKLADNRDLMARSAKARASTPGAPPARGSSTRGSSTRGSSTRGSSNRGSR